MRLADAVREAYVATSSNKVRSGLTVLGIVIGIASVITMVAIGQGTKQSVENRIASIGANLLMVQPGIQRGGPVSAGRGSARSLTEADATAIGEQLPEAAAVAPEVSGQYQITSTKGANTNARVTGTVPAYTTVRNLEMEVGSFITQEQVRSAARVAVLGSNVRDDLFGAPAEGGQNPLGQTVRVGSVACKVIGVAKAKGGAGFGSADDSVFVPLTTAQRYLARGNYISSVSVQARSREVATQLQNDITTLLLQRHKIPDAQQADFFVINQADIAQSASDIANTLTLLLAGIAGISLVVGGIGIMNMMLTTVSERTREIGLRKAVGAGEGDISLQFLAEAVMLTFLGGAIGIVLGWLASKGLDRFAGLSTRVSPGAVLLAFGVSALIGIVFGFYPARRAASLNPIEALRHE